MDFRSLKDKMPVRYRFFPNGVAGEWRFGLLRVRNRKITMPPRFRGPGDVYFHAGDPCMLWIENEPDAEFIPEEFQDGAFHSGSIDCEICPIGDELAKLNIAV